MTPLFDKLAYATRQTKGRFPFYHLTEKLRLVSAKHYAGHTRTMDYEGYELTIEPSKYVGGKLWWAYGREWNLMNWAHENSRPGVFIDVGACLGEWSYYMERRGRRPIAFEPNPAYADMLSRNGIEVHEVGLGDSVGAMKLVEDEANEGAAKLADDPNGTRLVLPLDKLNLPGFTLMKIDVEGMELEVLSGARESIERYRPTIIVEDNQGGAAAYFLYLYGYRIAARFGTNLCLTPDG